MKKLIFTAICGLLLTACGNQAAEQGEASITKTVEPQVQALIDFGQCLTDKEAIFYGTTWCSHCKRQKAILGEAMETVTHIDCDKQKALCIKAGIEGYPTWVIKGDTKLVGAQELADLAKATGCVAPNET